VRAALDEVFSAERYQWNVPPDPWRWLRDLIREVTAWFSRLEVEHPGVYYVLVVALAALFVAILVHMGYLTWVAFRTREDERSAAHESVREVRDAAWHMRRALELEDAGAFAESLAHRFAALVHLLDRKKVIRAHPSKTPAEYLLEARLDPPGREAFEGVVRWLYDHLFGGRPLDAVHLREFDQRVQEVTAHGPA
jgi:hypothetical protein